MSPDPEPLFLPTPPASIRRLVYFGTPDMAVPPLRALHEAGFEIVLVVTRPDRRRGRGGELQPSPVKAAALELGLRVTDDIDDVLADDAGADIGVVVAYGRIIRRRVLERLPLVNIHFSLLPRWRGAAPVERAVLAGDDRTGVDLMVVEEGLDTGGIYAETVLDIGPDESAAELRERLVEAGSTLLVERLTAGLGPPQPQQGETVYAAKIDPAEYEIDWTRPAIELRRLIRLGGAWTMFRNKRFKIWRSSLVEGGPLGAGSMDGSMDGSIAGLMDGSIAGLIDGVLVGTGSGVLELGEVQPEGKARQSADAWRNGARPVAGERFGT